ncbi:hypothetical protein L210DRAFT_3557197 [Boletus edulis BED1]|uniref:Uncharacterized protein n=1 Tax=Boletus edulis BED1 TaxID=1328754 RepID=A0AAD4BKV0_BOLED|nr:hypothetical protein L210DRAFT_3557197 [Boletus edulis BED1]
MIAQYCPSCSHHKDCRRPRPIQRQLIVHTSTSSDTTGLVPCHRPCPPCPSVQP